MTNEILWAGEFAYESMYVAFRSMKIKWKEKKNAKSKR